VDIGERLTAHVEDLRTTHPAADISTSIEVGTRVYAHPLIDSAIENLLESAVQHAGPNPDVDVVCRQSDEPGDGAVEVRIADDGPGIPPTEVEVLERGYETPLDHTSGLGLWIVNWIVTESGGSVWFEANEPEGSIVCFRLEPVEAEGPALPATLAN
jgi:signal transduction histidine kinase